MFTATHPALICHPAILIQHPAFLEFPIPGHLKYGQLNLGLVGGFNPSEKYSSMGRIIPYRLTKSKGLSIAIFDSWVVMGGHSTWRPRIAQHLGHGERHCAHIQLDWSWRRLKLPCQLSAMMGADQTMRSVLTCFNDQIFKNIRVYQYHLKGTVQHSE
jgi:hypothetical protein